MRVARLHRRDARSGASDGILLSVSPAMLLRRRSHQRGVQKGAVLAALAETVAAFYPSPRDCPDVSRIINVRHAQRLAQYAPRAGALFSP